jgi:hypothetical protein
MTHLTQKKLFSLSRQPPHIGLSRIALQPRRAHRPNKPHLIRTPGVYRGGSDATVHRRIYCATYVYRTPCPSWERRPDNCPAGSERLSNPHWVGHRRRKKHQAQPTHLHLVEIHFITPSTLLMSTGTYDTRVCLSTPPKHPSLMCTKLEDACTTHVRIVKQAGTAVSLLHQNWPQKDTESHSQYRAGPQPTMTYKAC